MLRSKRLRLAAWKKLPEKPPDVLGFSLWQVFGTINLISSLVTDFLFLPQFMFIVYGLSGPRREEPVQR